MGRRTVRITRNFDKNLADIRRFLEEQEAPREFRSLLEQLFETVIPNLERFSEMGVDFLVKMPQSTEGLMRLETLTQRLGKNTSLREYISGDYLVLYALRGDSLYLLSIKHHRQLSFDLKDHWGR
jgi:ParE toxin of type II toxin-antitoxin system, parDE